MTRKNFEEDLLLIIQTILDGKPVEGLKTSQSKIHPMWREYGSWTRTYRNMGATFTKYFGSTF